TEPYRSALALSWGVAGVEGLYSGFIADGRLAAALRDGERGRVNTDDRTLIEFEFARSVGRAGLFEAEDLFAPPVARGDGRPPAARGRCAPGALEGERGGGGGGGRAPTGRLPRLPYLPMVLPPAPRPQPRPGLAADRAASRPGRRPLRGARRALRGADARRAA